MHQAVHSGRVPHKLLMSIEVVAATDHNSEQTRDTNESWPEARGLTLGVEKETATDELHSQVVPNKRP